MTNIILLGTCDSKLAELRYLRDRILAHGNDVRVILVDVGRSSIDDAAITISPAQLLVKYGATALSAPLTIHELRELPRGEMLATTSALAVACVRDLLENGDSVNGSVSGIIAAGGSGNTSVAAAAMKACPVGFPKLLVSTIANGDVSPIVGEADVTLMYSVVDIAGLNGVLRGVLDNAAAAITGMATAYVSRAAERASKTSKPALQIGITMFGVTTPCVDAARQRLEEQGAEVYVFHATGSGGKSLERLVNEGALDAVLDVTTTEICDYLVGGVMSAGPDRLRASLERGIPYIVSLGACDMVNFGARATVPMQFNSRQLLEHNSLVTLMRTSPDECAKVGTWIGCRLAERAADQSCVELWIPEGGVSLLDVPGQPFHDSTADHALIDALMTEMNGSNIKVIHDKRAINDVEFAVNMADRLVELIRRKKDQRPETNADI